MAQSGRSSNHSASLQKADCREHRGRVRPAGRQCLTRETEREREGGTQENTDVDKGAGCEDGQKGMKSRPVSEGVSRDPVQTHIILCP